MSTIGMTTWLNDGEQLICKGFAKRRHEANRNANVTNRKYGPQSDEQIDLNGIGGELAFCKIFNVMPDFSLSPRSALAGNDFGDAVIQPWGLDGGKILVDIKTTNVINGRLIAPMTKQPNRDMIFCLMVGELPTYCFRGFYPNLLMLHKRNIVTINSKECFAVLQDQLMSLQQIKEYYANQ